MPDLMKLSHRQVEALLGLSRNSYNWIHGPSTDSTLKALRRMGLVNLSWDDSVAGYMFGSQPCWSITDAGRKRILAIQGTLTEEPEQQFNPSPGRHEPGKSDSDRLAEQLETIARLEKELEESEKRGSELAASYCDGVVGDEYGHTYCRYKAERDAALAEVERLREENANLILACASLDSEKREIQHKWDAIIAMRGDALARVAELEMKLDKADYAYDNDRIHMRGLAARAIARAKVFDDGSDGADAESARSVVAILRELLAVGGASAQHSAPDGYAMIPVRETEAMHDAVMALLYNGVARTDTQKLLDAYINAATNKESV
ncbi:hypothetical protein cory_14 [Pseudomonas phage cory]|nr:hypothetical protein cory_14 [Pseudomonas phage cory]WKV20600.1 hypothetical protein PhageC_00045 [Pseudomonas phage C_MDJ-2023]